MWKYTTKPMNFEPESKKFETLLSITTPANHHQIFFLLTNFGVYYDLFWELSIKNYAAFGQQFANKNHSMQRKSLLFLYYISYTFKF